MGCIPSKPKLPHPSPKANPGTFPHNTPFRHATDFPYIYQSYTASARGSHEYRKALLAILPNTVSSRNHGSILQN